MSSVTAKFPEDVQGDDRWMCMVKNDKKKDMKN